MVSLHKQQFGRGPTNARTHFAGPDTLVCTLEGALLPAEHALVEMGDQQRVREARLHYQVATGPVFVRVVEELINRKVHAFAVALDPDQDVLFEVFTFEPRDPASS